MNKDLTRNSRNNINNISWEHFLKFVIESITLTSNCHISKMTASPNNDCYRNEFKVWYEKKKFYLIYHSFNA